MPWKGYNYEDPLQAVMISSVKMVMIRLPMVNTIMNKMAKAIIPVIILG